MRHYPEAVTLLGEASPGRPAEARWRLRTRSAVGTQALAAALAGWLEPGDVVVLSGDLGAGKTTFTQGLARQLGVVDPVTSPTFTILQQYRGVQRLDTGEAELQINHLDVYRLGSLDEAEALGLDELLDGDSVTLVEWGEGIEPLLGTSRLTVTLQLAPLKGGEPTGAGDDDPLDHRLVSFELVGTGRSRRQSLDRALHTAVDSGAARWESDEPC